MNSATPQLIEQLTAVVGAARVLTAPIDLASYGFDGTALLRQRPACVVFPRTTEEVAVCLRTTHAALTPVVVRGSGTGLSGGSVPVAGGSSCALWT